MARGKANKSRAFEKILELMLSGEPTSIADIDSKLGKEIQMYRISTYIWDIKAHANGIVKTIKDGRKVVAYQLINVAEMKAYLKRVQPTKQKVENLTEVQGEAAPMKTEEITVEEVEAV